MGTSKTDASVRERLLAAADDLFYQEGIHTVGIDRVLEQAGVAKASLYGTFGSKDELVRAYLERRALVRRERISQRVAQYDKPRERILCIFDLLGEIAAEPTFRGCAFVNASAEGPRGATPITQACSDGRAWVRSLFTQLARDLGAHDAERTGRRLALLYDGAMTGASRDSDPSAAREARSIAEELLDTSTGPRTVTRIPALPSRAPVARSPSAKESRKPSRRRAARTRK
jgi:AcrR family transcriptional regulator